MERRRWRTQYETANKPPSNETDPLWTTVRQTNTDDTATTRPDQQKREEVVSVNRIGAESEQLIYRVCQAGEVLSLSRSVVFDS